MPFTNAASASLFVVVLETFVFGVIILGTAPSGRAELIISASSTFAAPAVTANTFLPCAESILLDVVCCFLSKSFISFTCWSAACVLNGMDENAVITAVIHNRYFHFLQFVFIVSPFLSKYVTCFTSFQQLLHIY